MRKSGKGGSKDKYWRPNSNLFKKHNYSGAGEGPDGERDKVLGKTCHSCVSSEPKRTAYYTAQDKKFDTERHTQCSSFTKLLLRGIFFTFPDTTMLFL